MKVTLDTNVLIRSVVQDNLKQARAADKILGTAALLAISLPCLCEFVWVLRRVYDFDNATCATAVQALLNTDNVVTNRPAAEAGLALLEAGGDFADGAIAHEGKWLGGETFVSFDKKAVALLSARGESTRLLEQGAARD
jgi:predicted nucleic-acid-binding protein